LPEGYGEVIDRIAGQEKQHMGEILKIIDRECRG
jgi:rubrerythrin